jgi:hypothetical protein
MRFLGFLSHLAGESVISYRSCFQSFTPAGRLMSVDTGFFEEKYLHQHRTAGLLDCARDALKTASNGHWRLKRLDDSTAKIG